MIRFELNNYGTGSVITCLDDMQHISSIIYTRKIHGYESRADFQTIKTELLTYGEGAGYEIYNYFRGAREFTQKSSTQGNGRIGGAGLATPAGYNN